MKFKTLINIYIYIYIYIYIIIITKILAIDIQSIINKTHIKFVKWHFNFQIK